MAATSMTRQEYNRLVLGYSKSQARTSKVSTRGPVKKLEPHHYSEIRQIMTNFALIEKKRPTVNCMRAKVNASELGIELSYRGMRNALQELGYK